MSIKEIISKMTLEDKISLCTGEDFWHTKKMEKYGIPSIMMCDGPHGLRCQKGVADIMGISKKTVENHLNLVLKELRKITTAITISV